MWDYQAGKKEIISLIERAREIQEQAKNNSTVEKRLKVMQVMIDLNRRVSELVSESIEQSKKFLEDSRELLDKNSNYFAVTLPVSLKEKKLWTIVADDHRLMRNKTVEIITPQFEVIGTAADGIAASEMIRLLKPEVAVLDISMPYRTGIEITADLKKYGSEVKVVILTAHDDFGYREAAFRAGVSGYVRKVRMGIDLIPAIKSVSAGGTFISPQSW